MFFDIKDIESVGSWSVLIVGLLVLAGFFALPVLLFVGAAYALSVLFGKGNRG